MRIHIQLKAENRRGRCWGLIRWPIDTRRLKSGGLPDCPCDIDAAAVSHPTGHCNCVPSQFSFCMSNSQMFVNDEVNVQSFVGNIMSYRP